MDRTEEEDLADSSKEDKQPPPPIQKFIGFVVGLVLVYLAQRDLRKRPPELVRGKTGVWKVVAFVPPGAVAYLIFGRRRRSAVEASVLDELLAA